MNCGGIITSTVLPIPLSSLEKKQKTTTKKYHKEHFYITELQNISRIVMQIVSTSASVFHSTPIDLE